MSDKLTAPLQESILALIATNSKQGHIAASMLTPKSFNETYEDIASRILIYHKENGQAPGKAHLDDLCDDILGNPQHKQYKLYLRILEGILASSGSLNPDYLLARIGKFNDRQRLKRTVQECIDVFGQGGEGVEDRIKTIMIKGTRDNAQSMDAGVRLSDKNKALAFLDRDPIAFSTGIPIFDHNNLGLAYKRLLMMIAGKGVGKSWWLVDLGRRALMQKGNVLHITLENSWEETIQRYYQNMWAISEKLPTVEVTKFKFDELRRLNGLGTKMLRSRIRLKDKDIRSVLSDKIDEWGARISGLIVKEFPAGSLTIDQLDAYIDYLELHENFIPNVVLVDYLDLLAMRKDVDKRIALGETYIEFRGLLQRRHLCGASPTQGNRESLEASIVKASMISEDITKVNTADMTITYSQTEEEKKLGLARLGVPHNRIGRDKYTVLITQNYDIGQFCMESTILTSNYKDMLKERREE